MWAGVMLRRHRLATVLLVALVAVPSALVIAAVAAARRADGSIGRFTAASRSFDAIVFSCPPGVDPRSFESQQAINERCLNAERTRAVVDELRSFPGVESVATGGYFVAGVADPDAPNGWGRITLLSASWGGGAYLAGGQPKVLTGRAPNPKADDEVMITERAARRSGLRVGERISLGSWSAATLDAAVNDGRAPTLGPVDVRVVGIGRFQSDLTPGEAVDVSGNYLGGEIHTTGATARRLRGFANYGIAPALRLHDGPAGVAAFRAALRRRWSDRFFQLETSATSLGDNRSAEQEIDTERRALLAFAGIAIAAIAGLVGLTIVRQLRREQIDVGTLRELGMRRREVVAGSSLRMVWIAGPAAVSAAILAIAISPLAPLGLARRAEPKLGVDVDLLVVGVGALVIVATLLALAALVELYPQRTQRARRPRRNWLDDMGAAMGPTQRVGFGFSHGPWPRVATAVTAIAVASLVAAGVTVATVDKVVGDPARYGAWWDLDLGDYSEPGPIAAGGRILAADPDVRVVAGYEEQSGAIVVNGRPVTIEAYTHVAGRVEPVMLRGRAPRGDDEIALGPATRRALGVDIGDKVTAASAQSRDTSTNRRLTVTGETLVNDPVTTSNNLGDGGLVVASLLDEFSPGVPQRLLVRLDDGADPHTVIRRLARSYSGPMRTVAPPDDVRNLARLRFLPWLIAGLVVVLAMVTLAHALSVTVSRRRRDLALLAVFGLERRGVRAVTAWSTTVLIIAAAVIGVPLGLITGRLLWSSVAHANSIESAPALGIGVAIASVASVAAVAIVAQVVTLIETRRGTRPSPAELLRVE
jgi:hypothetical protein